MTDQEKTEGPARTCARCGRRYTFADGQCPCEKDLLECEHCGTKYNPEHEDCPGCDGDELPFDEPEDSEQADIDSEDEDGDPQHEGFDPER